VEPCSSGPLIRCCGLPTTSDTPPSVVVHNVLTSFWTLPSNTAGKNAPGLSPTRQSLPLWVADLSDLTEEVPEEGRGSGWTSVPVAGDAACLLGLLSTGDQCSDACFGGVTLGEASALVLRAAEAAKAGCNWQSCTVKISAVSSDNRPERVEDNGAAGGEDSVSTTCCRWHKGLLIERDV